MFTYLVSQTIIMWLIYEENGKKRFQYMPMSYHKKILKKCFSLILEREMPMGNLLTSFVLLEKQWEKQWELPSLYQTSDLSQEAQPMTQSSS